MKILSGKETIGWTKFLLGEMNEEKDIMEVRMGIFTELLYKPPVLKKLKNAK